MALSNKTTIENLEKKNEEYLSLFDIGAKSNWKQIFGMNKMLWPFPMFAGSGKPLGDGIYWPTNRNEDSNRSHHGQSGSNDQSRKQTKPIVASLNSAAFAKSKFNQQSLLNITFRPRSLAL